MRLYNLDYLRGFAALSIMIYHYSGYTFGIFDAGTTLGRLGIYGVAVFYVLSGLTLYYVYNGKMNTGSDLKRFYKKRVFRIFPLLWLTTIAYIILSRTLPDPTMLALNLSGLFGLVAWDRYFSDGVWSIGNELVFYLFLPAFIYLLSKRLLWVAGAILFTLYALFTFKWVSGPTLASQWHDYTNPMNQVFLFFGGFAIGHLFKYANLRPVITVCMMITAVLLFIFYPVSGDTINLVTGWNRIIFTVICFAVCLSFYKLTLHLPKIIEKPLTMLGESSYSVYLLHPLVYSVVAIMGTKIGLGKIAIMSVAIPVTLGVAYVVYQRFEKFFIAYSAGRRLYPSATVEVYNKPL